MLEKEGGEKKTMNATKALLTAMAFALLVSTVWAARPGSLQVYDVNVEWASTPKDFNGAGFITTDTNIHFRVIDTNTNAAYVAAATKTVSYIADITYATTKGATTTSIANDLNLGTQIKSAGYCDANVGSKFVNCEYTWPAAIVNAISDGNYYIDVNVLAIDHFVSDLATVDQNTNSDLNMDTNSSFYVDNSVPTCSLEKRQGNQYAWILSEGVAESQGSQTTFYTSVVDKGHATSYSSTTAKQTDVVLGTYTVGNKDYQCYASDLAGNTGTASLKYNIEYPPQGAEVVINVSGGGVVSGNVAQATVDIPIVGSVVAYAQANPLFAIIAVGAIVLLLSGGKKRKRRR